MAHFHDNALVGASGQGGYQISRSLRFNSADSAYLNRTPGAGGGITKGAISAWIKRSALGTTQSIIQARQDVNNQQYIGFTTNDTIEVGITAAGTTTLSKVTSAVYRDCSAWYHIFFYQDNTLATAEDRYQLYVNGVRVTAWSTNTNTAPQNTSTFLGTSNPHYIGAYNAIGGYYNGYITEYHFIYQPATVPTVSGFGETDTITGVWKPKKYAGTYGTNGFYLNFADNSGTTSTTLGKDSSGNGNNWTPNNFAVTPVTGYLLPGFDIVNGNGVFGNATLPAVGNGTNAYHFPKANATYTLSKTLTATSKIEAYCYIDGSTGPTIQANGGSAITIPTGSGYAWSKVNLGVTSLSSITLNAASWTARDFWIACFIVDDVVVYGTPALAVGNDSVTDSPTSYGVNTGGGADVRGNYATFSPVITSSQGTATLVNGNLDISGSGSNYTGALSSIAVASGKWYWEYTVNSVGSASGPGIIATTSLFSAVGGTYGFAAASDAWFRYSTYVYSNGTAVASGLSSLTTSDVAMIALDVDAGKLWFGRNGTWESSGNPATGANATITFTPGGKSFYAFVQGYGSGGWSGSFNAGQRQWIFTAPSGFVALNTQNLPEPSIKKPSSYFDVKTWTATGTDPLVVSGLGFSPDLVWAKARNDSYNHVLVDSVRGVNNVLSSNLTNAEASYTTVTQFNSDGFNAGGTTNNNYSLNCAATVARTYVGWCWDESATPGFDIVTYTGNGVNGRQISHNLGVKPKLIIEKGRGSTYNWSVQGCGELWTPATSNLFLNGTSGLNASGAFGAPTSTFFYPSLVAYANENGVANVAYLWSEVAGFSRFGSYTGNGSTDGSFVFCGFRPKFLLCKKISSTGSWAIYDSARDSYNVSSQYLYPNLSAVEATFASVDFLSNGFKWRETAVGFNDSGATYIFAAFAETPQKYSLAR